MMQKPLRLIVFLFVTLLFIFLSGNFFFNKHSTHSTNNNRKSNMAQFQVVLREGIVGGFAGPTVK